jgi:ferredoxin
MIKRKFAMKIEESMAIIITDQCINCGACEPECPNNAIYEGGVSWTYAQGTALGGLVRRPDGSTTHATDQQTPVSDDVYFIVPDKCTECEGFHEEPQCAAVCPVDCCVPDPDRRESTETLLDRKQYLHDQANH